LRAARGLQLLSVPWFRNFAFTAWTRIKLARISVNPDVAAFPVSLTLFLIRWITPFA
jgi:hypothetical protein